MRIAEITSEADLPSPKSERRRRSAVADSGVSVLKDLYVALDSALILIETSAGLRRDVGKGIDFYDEVRNFEISLIEQALRKTQGCQVRAAALLRLKTTTLNTKIKNYAIDCREPARMGGLAERLRVANK